jgi:hypothetical protein
MIGSLRFNGKPDLPEVSPRVCGHASLKDATLAKTDSRNCSCTINIPVEGYRGLKLPGGLSERAASWSKVDLQEDVKGPPQ